MCDIEVYRACVYIVKIICMLHTQILIYLCARGIIWTGLDRRLIYIPIPIYESYAVMHMHHWYQQQKFWNNKFYGTLVFHSILMLYDSRSTKLFLTMITISPKKLIALRHHIHIRVSTKVVSQRNIRRHKVWF